MNKNEYQNSSSWNSSNYNSSNKYAANFVAPSKNKVDIQSKIKQEKNDNEKSRHEKHKAQNLAKLMTSFVALVSGAAVFAVGVDAFVPETTAIVAQIDRVFTTDTDVSYYIFLENYEGEDDVYVVLYNDFTNRMQKVEEQMMEGTFENLQTNMKYTLAVKKGSKILAKKIVRTVFEEPHEEWDEQYDEWGDDKPYIEDDENNGRPNTSDNGDNQDPTVGGGN